ncbi:MAG: hypothetical protein M3070_02470, partial [Actinomycetota bacterium]|nr:hypothetical protein [Actinomycetota bacterium]
RRSGVGSPLTLTDSRRAASCRSHGPLGLYVACTVTSSDGTRIAYGLYGHGPAVILVNGALGYRKDKNLHGSPQPYRSTAP